MDHDPLENEYPDDADLDDADDPDDDQVPCPVCDAWIYDDTEQCPHCGHWIVPGEALRGRRPWILIAVAVMMLLLMLVFVVRG